MTLRTSWKVNRNERGVRVRVLIISLIHLGKAFQGKPRRKPESGNPTFRACRGARGNVILSCPFDTVSAPRLYPDHVRF
jgi:hypothetical protein